MALSIKTEEADRLARELSRITGETMTEAITKSLAERLERVRKTRQEDKDLPARVAAFVDRMARNYDVRPITKKEWDQASGDSE